MIARVHRIFVAFSFSVSRCKPNKSVSPACEQPVEVLRDRWGVPHIYARNTHDLFFAQGYITATDRLWQIDMWRRIGTGKLAEVLGPSAIRRDQLARAVQYRGDWDAEWKSYGPETKEIATAFTAGINAYIRSSKESAHWNFSLRAMIRARGSRGLRGSELPGLLMTRNITREVARAQDARRFGLPELRKYLPPDPAVALEVPRGLDLEDIGPAFLRPSTRR